MTKRVKTKNKLNMSDSTELKFVMMNTGPWVGGISYSAPQEWMPLTLKSLYQPEGLEKDGLH